MQRDGGSTACWAAEAAHASWPQALTTAVWGRGAQQQQQQVPIQLQSSMCASCSTAAAGVGSWLHPHCLNLTAMYAAHHDVNSLPPARLPRHGLTQTRSCPAHAPSAHPPHLLRHAALPGQQHVAHPPRLPPLRHPPQQAQGGSAASQVALPAGGQATLGVQQLLRQLTGLGTHSGGTYSEERGAGMSACELEHAVENKG